MSTEDNVTPLAEVELPDKFQEDGYEEMIEAWQNNDQVIVSSDATTMVENTESYAVGIDTGGEANELVFYDGDQVQSLDIDLDEIDEAEFEELEVEIISHPEEDGVIQIGAFQAERVETGELVVGGSQFFVGDSEPVEATENDFWFDTS